MSNKGGGEQTHRVHIESLPRLRSMKSSLVYVDERLVVVNKAAGISLATRRAEPHAAVSRLLDSIDPQERANWGLDAEDLRLCHRIDSGTTGLVVLARDAETHRAVAAGFQSRTIDKAYLALVWGHPRPQDGRYDVPIAPDPKDRRRMRADRSGRPAVTRYKTLARGPGVSLLELHPETGRTHQLRVHLANTGHWIVGDDLYTGARHRGIKKPERRLLFSPPSLLLHAWRLHLPAASRLQERIFEAPLPAHFQRVLDALGMTTE